ncbi:MAG: hypothetical protein O3B09_03770, partial [Proteobacteria bacterium]|nr:hypothetical protein [Pseudomonadota bacterium]
IFTLIIFVIALRFTPYKDLKREVNINTKPIKGYISKDSELGYDINPNIKDRIHQTNEFSYEVFSNQYGCFDYERKVPDDYSLIVGDSFTWGFTPLEKKWTSYLEEKSGLFMLKCGVSGFGTRQELLKAQRVIKQVKKTPKYLILLYYANDLNDDFFFAHIGKKGIEGVNLVTGELDIVQKEEDNNKLKAEVKHDDIKEHINQSVKKLKGRKPVFNWRESLRKARYNTVIYNLYMIKVKPQIRAFIKKVRFGNNMPDYMRGRYREWFINYLHQKDELPWYGQLIEYHKQSLQNFIDYSAQINAQFLVIDIEGSLDNEVFKDLFAGKKGVYYYNLKKDYPRQATWKQDGHWNITGNQEAGEHIYQHFNKLGVFK